MQPCAGRLHYAFGNGWLKAEGAERCDALARLGMIQIRPALVQIGNPDPARRACWDADYRVWPLISTT